MKEVYPQRVVTKPSFACKEVFSGSYYIDRLDCRRLAAGAECISHAESGRSSPHAPKTGTMEAIVLADAVRSEQRVDGLSRWIAVTLLTGAAGLSSVPASAREVSPEASPIPTTPPSSDAMTLDEAIALAMRANRDLMAARLRAGIAQAGIQTAREIPNPDLTFEETKEAPREALTLAQP